MSNLKPNIQVKLFKLTSEQINMGIKNSSITPVQSRQIEIEFNSFEQLDISDEEHRIALSKLLPTYLTEECDNTDWELFLSMSRYDNRNQSFVAGCFDNTSALVYKLISYKHRYKDGIKWKTRAGTSPNSTPFVRIYSDNEPIFVIEGHRDALTAILIGLDFIMLPYAGFRLIDPTYLQSEVRGRDVIFLIEDKQAYKCMSEVALYLADTAKTIRLVDFTNDIDKKVDLSDYVCNFNTIKEVLYGLRNLR